MTAIKMTDQTTGTSWSTSKWLSKTAAAKYIHRSPAALQQLLDSGAIPASQAPFERGGAPVVYISIDDLDDYMRSTPYRPSKPTSVVSSVSGDRLGEPLERARLDIPPYRAIARNKRARVS